MCYSPDSGKTWFRQWISNPSESINYPGNVPQEIKFFGRNNGYFFTKRNGFYSDNGGRKWKQIYYGGNILIKKVHFLTENKMLLEFIKYGRKSDFPGKRGTEYSPGLIYFEDSTTITNHEDRNMVIFHNPLGPNFNRQSGR